MVDAGGGKILRVFKEICFSATSVFLFSRKWRGHGPPAPPLAVRALKAVVLLLLFNYLQ